jgi:hypothetical protein
MVFRRKLLLAAAVLSGLIICLVGPAAATTWDVALDFSTTNPNPPWEYGYSANILPGYTVTAYGHLDTATLNPLEVWTSTPSFSNPSLFYNPTNSAVNIPTNNPGLTLPAHQVALHPGQNGQYSIAEWIAPTTGQYLINAVFTGYANAGTTTDVHVLLDGGDLHPGNINAYLAQVAYSSVLTITAGQTVDFAVGMIGNINDHDYTSDTTGLAATITSVPLPPTVLLLGSGLMGLGLLGFRRKNRG